MLQPIFLPQPILIQDWTKNYCNYILYEIRRQFQHFFRSTLWFCSFIYI